MKRLKLALILGVSILISGCGNLRYLMQAGKGQMELFNRARPISEVLKDERTPPQIRNLLKEISPIKKFGEVHGLKPTLNYTEYVKLNRNAAVWVVSASEKLRFFPKEWSFPLVGSFPYLGWFDLSDAKEYARELQKEGWDVDVRGAGAYSTLGWFRDSVLSTMIPEGKEAIGGLANIVLHESVHATLYIKNQSFFNESIANFIADEMTLTYLDQTFGESSLEKRSYQEAETKNQEIQKRFHRTYLELSQLYASSETDEEKLKKKDTILSQLKAELKLKKDINNATLIQFKTYNSNQGDFLRLFQKCERDWPKFLGTLKTLTPNSFSKLQQEDLASVLSSLFRASCPQL